MLNIKVCIQEVNTISKYAAKVVQLSFCADLIHTLVVVLGVIVIVYCLLYVFKMFKTVKSHEVCDPFLNVIKLAKIHWQFSEVYKKIKVK